MLSVQKANLFFHQFRNLSFHDIKLMDRKNEKHKFTFFFPPSFFLLPFLWLNQVCFEVLTLWRLETKLEFEAIFSFSNNVFHKCDPKTGFENWNVLLWRKPEQQTLLSFSNFELLQVKEKALSKIHPIGMVYLLFLDSKYQHSNYLVPNSWKYLLDLWGFEFGCVSYHVCFFRTWQINTNWWLRRRFLCW